MNGRFILGIALLILLFLAGLGAWFGTASLNRPIRQALENAVEEAAAERWDAAVALAECAKNRWQTYRALTASIADHTPMDEIDALFASIHTYARLEQKEEFAATCAQLAQRIQSMEDVHRLTWWNFL